MIYDIAIIGAGCSGLSLAYQLYLKKEFNFKVIILDNKNEFKKDRTWSFWKIYDHEFKDCIEREWNSVEIKNNHKIKKFSSNEFPYQSIDSLKFYNKIFKEISNSYDVNLNANVQNINHKDDVIEIELNTESIKAKKVFDTRNPSILEGKLYQHFYGIEIEVDNNYFENHNVTLMDFDCEQKNGVHFFYILPFAKNRALIETTWLSPLIKLDKKNYEEELNQYLIDNFPGLTNYKIVREEIGAIPMFRKKLLSKKNYFEIGLRGNINRMSTGYAFIYIQQQSKLIVEKIFNNQNLVDTNPISKKYEFLDRLFVKVLKNNPNIMPDIFYKIFNQQDHNSIIKFLSSNGSFFDDLKVIKKMPKYIFLKNLIN